MDLPTFLEWLRLLLKATLGMGLFSLILWCAQSRNPRAVGMMLTFPALNGIGLLTAETDSLFLMVQAMPPMIALNGVLCASYILLQRRLDRQTTRVPWLVQRLGILGVCLCLWGAMACWVAPGVQRYLDSTRSMLTFLSIYAACGLPLTVLYLWYPTTSQTQTRLSFRQVLKGHILRVGGVFVFIILVMLLARHGAEAWAGRVSTLPVLPFYSLLVLSSMSASTAPGPSRLDQVGSTVLAGPLVAITFAWAYAAFLQALRCQGSTTFTAILAVVGLLAFWGFCGAAIWGGVRLAQTLEQYLQPQTVSHEPG